MKQNTFGSLVMIWVERTDEYVTISFENLNNPFGQDIPKGGFAKSI
jgi:hypothetical protein